MDLILLVIGSEIIKGARLDTNSHFMAGRLTQAGFRVREVRCVADEERQIIDALRSGFRKAPVVIATGGLGPTPDDLTKQAACRFFRKRMYLDQNLLAQLKERFERIGYASFPERNVNQALVPEGARILPNPLGTAQGLLLEKEGIMLFLLPGVPVEMRGLMDEQVLPLLKERFPGSVPATAIVRTVGIGESLLAEKAEQGLGPDLTRLLGYYPRGGMVDVVIGSPWAAADDQTILSLADHVAATLGDFVYARDERSLVEVIFGRLRSLGATLAVAESCTGGLLSKTITDTPGSSAFFDSGLVSYSNQAKAGFLGVPEGLLSGHGAVSEQACRAMAEGLRERTRAAFTLAVTGVAGPSGGSPEKPVGTVYIGLCSGKGTEVCRYSFPGDRQQIRQRSAVKALEMLWRALRAKTVRGTGG